MLKISTWISALVLATAFLVANPAAADIDYTPDQPSVAVDHCSAFWGECDVQIEIPLMPNFPYPPFTDKDDTTTVLFLLSITNTKRPLSKPLLKPQYLSYTAYVAQDNPLVELTLDAGTYEFTWQGRPDSEASWSGLSPVTEVKMGGVFGAEDPDSVEGPPGTITARAFSSGRVATVIGQVRPGEGVPHVGGDSVRVKYRFPGQTSYQDGGWAHLDDDGRFSWSKVTGRKIYISVRAGDVKAPRLIVRPDRSRSTRS